MKLRELYRHSLALLTDLYQLTMAFGYWKDGLAERDAVFHLFFRKPPFGGAFAIACGLEAVVDFVEGFHFQADDLVYLSELRGADDRRLFDTEFLDHLSGLRLNCTIDAVPEGTAVFAQEPLVRVRGPLLQCQLLETPLLNLINFQTLVATKAARIALACQDQLILEFGLRRAQGIDGGLSASRAAYVGGCHATSNVLAGKLYHLPVKGTHAHSWVMAYENELAAFDAYSRALPNNTILLVDTYETRQGVKHAAQIGHRLRAAGNSLGGIRLDSGDLNQLSRDARQILDQEGFTDAAIVASGDLDEFAIQRLNRAGAPIDIWGVGTRLATAYDQPALGGVYKLAAVQDAQGTWGLRIKVSDDPAKSTIPGYLQVRRCGDDKLQGDVIFDEWKGCSEQLPHMLRGRTISWPASSPAEDLLIRVFQQGQRVYDVPAAPAARDRAAGQLRRLPAEVLRLESPVAYPVGLDAGLHQQRRALMATWEDKIA